MVHFPQARRGPGKPQSRLIFFPPPAHFFTRSDTLYVFTQANPPRHKPPMLSARADIKFIYTDQNFDADCKVSKRNYNCFPLPLRVVASNLMHTVTGFVRACVWSFSKKGETIRVLSFVFIRAHTYTRMHMHTHTGYQSSKISQKGPVMYQ